jgi:O-succinylbenzoate synthase
MLRIDRIVLRHLSVPLLHPFTTSFGTMREKEFLLVEVTDQDGVSGWGESVAFPEPSYNEETLRTNWHILECFLIPAAQKASLTHPGELQQHFRFVRGNNMAKAALEGAYWDLYARRQGQPLARVLGGKKPAIEVGVSIGIQSTVDHLLDKIADNIVLGYKRIKIKIKPGWDIEVVEKVRERFPTVPLMVDANSAYTLKDSVHLKQLDRFSLTMIEQPLAYDDIVDHRALQAQLETPLCLDESIHSAEDARKAIELGSCRIVNLKIGRVGGIAEAIRLHDLCQRASIPVWCGGMLESGIGRAHNIAISSLSNFVLPGDTAASANYWHEDIIEPEVTVTNGRIMIPDGEGIGFCPNLKRIRERTQHCESFRLNWSAPHL